MSAFPNQSYEGERRPDLDYAWWVAAPWPPSKDLKVKVQGPFNTWDQAQAFADKLEVSYLVGEVPTRDPGVATYILTHAEEFREGWE